ncbi:hypothetical protein F0365_09960 [Nonlabens sp. Ci31]|jgi:ketosteroid isomerase-like protein|uniref:nuclear transport factor 2 family protein n=1 Tax=Nonlabens sp. Ci31 TaxID=2608253 RepID=UPI001464699F|nr:nuclear transport factor 2 family protein [Nonlabens sp. Ci31]QJP34693.1 hypothetical protein F0365_09960 [Nonlabens sp. Ci31]
MKVLRASAIVLLILIGPVSWGQEKSYTDNMMVNPSGKEDIKVVTNYIDALMGHKMDIAADLLSDSYVGSGPSFGETETKAEYINFWKEAHAVRSNQNKDFVSHSFRVVDGNLKGDWVSIWGTYTFTQNTIEVNLPYPLTAMVTNGKIARSNIYYDKLAINTAMGYELTIQKTIEPYLKA